MAHNAVIDNTIGYVKRWGYSDFSSTLQTGETQVALNEGASLAVEPFYYNKVVAGEFVELSQSEKDAVDAAHEAEDTAELKGAVRIERVVSSAAALPLPPPAPGLLVGVVTATQIGLAISGSDRWFLFAVDAVVGP